MFNPEHVSSLELTSINKHTIDEAVREAIHLAGNLGIHDHLHPNAGALVTFPFNGVRISVKADSYKLEIVSYYHMAIKNKIDRVDPYPLHDDERGYELEGTMGLS